MGVSAVPMSVVPMSAVPMSAVHHVSCCELLSAVVSCWPFFKNKLLSEVQVQEEEQ